MKTQIFQSLAQVNGPSPTSTSLESFPSRHSSRFFPQFGYIPVNHQRRDVGLFSSRTFLRLSNNCLVKDLEDDVNQQRRNEHSMDEPGGSSNMNRGSGCSCIRRKQAAESLSNMRQNRTREETNYRVIVADLHSRRVGAWCIPDYVHSEGEKQKRGPETYRG